MIFHCTVVGAVFLCGVLCCITTVSDSNVCACLHGNRCHRQVSPVRAAPAAAAPSGAALQSSAHRATAVRVSTLQNPHETAHNNSEHRYWY